MLTLHTDDEFKLIALNRLRQEGIEDEELAFYITNAVLKDLRRRSLRNAIRIARKSTHFMYMELDTLGGNNSVIVAGKILVKMGVWLHWISICVTKRNLVPIL